MKNLFYTFISALFIFSFASCEPDTGDESFMENRETIAGFTASSATIFATADGTNNYNLSVAISKQSSSDVSFDISMSDSSTAAAEDYTMSASSVTVKAGELSGSVDIVANFDNASFDGKTLVLDLTASAGVFVGSVGTISIDIIKSCPIPDSLPSSWTAELGTEDLGAAVGSLASFTPTFTETPADDGLSYSVDNAWGEFVDEITSADYSGQFPYSGVLTVNPDGTVDFVGDASWATGGTGIFDACTGVITLKLSQALFSGSFTADVVYTPAN